MEQKERLIEETNKRYAKRRCTDGTKQTVAMYYEYCEYDTERMTFETYCDFVKEQKIAYTNAVFARNIIRNVLTIDMKIDKSLWPAKKYYDDLLKAIDIENEAEHLVKKDTMDKFSKSFDDFLENNKREVYYRKYLCIYFSWLAISSGVISKLQADNFKETNDGFVLTIPEKDISYRIEDKTAARCLKKILSNENHKPFFLRPIERFRDEQVEKIGNIEGKEVLHATLQTVFDSGIVYWLSQNKTPDISEDNQYLLAYYEAMSRFLYGEPLRSGEPLSSGEPLNSAEPTFDVEKEAEKYVPLSDWNVYVSTLSRDLLDERNISAAKPYVATFLAWNGIPAELIKLLTTKTLSTDGQEKLFIGNGINEIEIEANKRTCDIVGRLIIEEPPGVLFEDPHNFTREEGRRVGYIFGQPPVLNTDIEIVYTSGILYRLAKFGQEPDDKENLNYYKAVADYMYKGDD